MASEPGDASAAHEPCDAAEECSAGKKKSKFQTFKSFFVKKKAKESAAPSAEGEVQSSEDVHTRASPVLTDRDSDSGSRTGAGNEARSHDSVIASDSPSSERNEGLRSSQDGIHGKVKALQMQLKQAIRLGSPASVSKRRSDDSVTLSDDDGLPRSPQECSTPCTVLTASSQRSSGVVQRCSSVSLEGSESDDEQMSGASSRPETPQSSILVDFSQPASSLSCLDSSAAHHRIAVKANACAQRKSASRELRRRDLREKVLLRDAEDKLQASKTSTDEEESNEDVVDISEAQEASQIRVSSQNERDEHACSQRASRTSTTSAETSEEDSVSARDHVDYREILESSWENPITLELQTDDFLLDSACEVVPEEQGSLLEEVLSSLKGPLTSALMLESKDTAAQMKVEVTTEEDVVAKESAPNQTPVLEDEILPVQSTLSAMVLLQREVEDLEEASQEDGEQEVEAFAKEPSLEEEDVQVYEDEVEPEDYEVKIENREDQDDLARRDCETLEDVGGLEQNIEAKEVEEVIDEEEASRDEEYAFEEQEDRDAEELQEQVEPEDQSSPVEHKVQLEIKSEASCNVESHYKSDQVVEDSALESPEDLSQAEDLPESGDHPSFVVTTMLDLCFPRKTTSAQNQPEEKEDEQEETTEQNHGCEEDSNDNLELSIENEEPQEQTHALVRSTSNDALQELDQEESPSTPQDEPVFKESPSTDESSEMSTNAVESPVQKEKCEPPEEAAPENPFGVRLRKTAALQRYVSGEEGPTPSVQAEPAEVQKAPFGGHLARRTSLPKKPDQPPDGGVKPRRTSDHAVGNVAAETSEGPSWISLARQKQKVFKENSLDESSQEEVKETSPDLSSPVSKDHLKPVTSPVKVPCLLDISKPAPVEKERRSTSPPAPGPAPTPVTQDEPPWLALAKKKAKAWSEMPQIVQ
ncbi:acrosomal protein KIAA1210 isoform X2 [Trichomycterus rosablanca]